MGAATGRPQRTPCAARCGDPAAVFLEEGQKFGKFVAGDGLCRECYGEVAEGYVMPDPALLKLPSDGRVPRQREKKI
jgi:hypothetical protein